MTTTRKLMMAGFVLGLALMTSSGCKNGDKSKPKEKYFPALYYINKQVANVDTGLYSIMRINFIDSTHNDTVYIKRENFKDAARDFLSIPDLNRDEYHDRFTEETTFDESIGRVMMIYTPKDAKNEVIQRQEVLIKPDTPEDKVTSIFINTTQSNKDSSIEKKMLWKVDESFQVTTIKQYPGQPEITSTYKVSWNESNE